MTANLPKISRPVLKYYGGKFKLAPWIIKHFPTHERYIEPFGGAASVLLLKNPSRWEVYNDLNEEIVGLFRVLRDRDNARRLRYLLRLTPYSRAELVSCCEPSTDPVEQARRTIVRSLLSVGNSQEKTYPSFRNHTKNYHYLPQYFREYSDHLKLFTDRLLNVTIEKTDALKLMKDNDGLDTLQYLDPPYLVRRRMDHGYKEEMNTDTEHEAFLKVCLSLQSKIVISHYECELYNDMLSGWTRISKKATTGARTKGKCSATEVLYINPNALKQLTIF
jgi:DNA adenine methylase